ncbi:MAG: flippase [Ramlibacter sp.]|nr:flippase [Ramlibacter sp.]
MAVAVSFLALANVVKDLGTAAAIIQREKVEHRQIFAVFVANVVIGMGACLMLITFAPAIARIYEDAALADVIRVLAVALPLSTAGAVHQALLERGSRFRRLAVIEGIGAVSGLIAAVTAAIHGLGVFSLVAQTLTGAAVSSLGAIMASGWRPNLTLKSIVIKDLMALVPFSARVAMANLVNFGARNADVLIVGKLLGAAVTGAYLVALKLMLFPLQLVTFVVARAAYPLMSRAQEGGTLAVQPIFLHTLAIISTITAPMMTLLWLLREEVVIALVGGRWTLVPQLLIWMAPVGFIQSLTSTSGSLLMAINQPATLLRLSWLTLIAFAGAFAIGASFDLKTAVQLYLAANCAYLLIVGKLICRYLGLSPAKLAMAIAPAVACSIGMAAISLLLKWKLMSFPSGHRLAVVCSLGGLAYVGLYRLTFKDQFQRLIRGAIVK